MTQAMRYIPSTELHAYPHVMERVLRLAAERTVEEGDCLIWQGRRMHHSPVASVAGIARSMRPLLWMAQHQRPVPAGKLISTTCNVPGCLRAEHLWLTTRAAVHLRAGKAGLFSGPGKSARIAAKARAKAPKLTMAKAQEIRARRSEPCAALAAEFGVNESLIRRIWRNEAWAEHAANSSVFAWRPAA